MHRDHWWFAHQSIVKYFTVRLVRVAGYPPVTGRIRHGDFLAVTTPRAAAPATYATSRNPASTRYDSISNTE
jgi:hypothetical protein